MSSYILLRLNIFLSSTLRDFSSRRIQNLLYENAGDMTQVQQHYSQGREIIDAKQQEAVCTQIGSKVRVLYPTIVPSTESIKNLACSAAKEIHQFGANSLQD